MPFITQGKTNLTYILIVVILAVIVGGGILGYQFLLAPQEESKIPEIKSPESKTPEEVKPEEKAPEDETVDWKNYRNEEYGYETDYLGDWKVVEAKPRIGDKVEWTGDILIDGEVQKVTFLEKNYGFWPGSFEIRVLSNPDKLSIKDWWDKELKESDEWQKECLKENPSCPSLRDALISQEEMLFKNQVALKTSVFAFDHSQECIRTEKNHHIYTLCYDDSKANDDNYIKHNEIYNQIISNFRFIEEDEVANWKTYRNRKYGYQIKAPPVVKARSEEEVWFYASIEEMNKPLAQPVLVVSFEDSIPPDISIKKWLQTTYGTPDENVSELTIGQRDLTYLIQSEGGITQFHYLTRFKDNLVLQITTFSQQLATSEEFLNVLSFLTIQ